MKRRAVTACLATVAFLLGTVGALTAPADQQSDLKALVGEWVWDHSPACVGCRAFTVRLDIASVSPDGRMTATYRSPQVPDGVPVKPRATIADGKTRVAFNVGKLEFDLEYAKGLDSLRGPVRGFPPALQIREANFRRGK